ncbi:MAG: DNA polymerase III subunit delta [Planctomycetia bacterium]|nr:DNA polymerase III subunit delta [Planctomycetia bacterium]
MPVVPALTFLDSPPKDVRGSCALFGDEPFLKRQCLGVLRQAVLTGNDAELSLATIDGEKAAWRDVHDELAMLGLFGAGRRLVVVEDADDFVSASRPALEDYVQRPPGKNVLVLVVSTWPRNTRLYKFFEKSGLSIDCSAPAAPAIVKWLVAQAKKEHRATLDRDAAQQLLDMVGPELGLLDQELAKLASYAGTKAAIDAEMVRKLAGSWRTQTAWEMLDAALAGDAARAVAQLDRLLSSGEHPVAVLGPMGYALRQFAAAARLVDEGERQGKRVRLTDALTQAGVKPFKINAAEAQLRQVGRVRALQLHRRLLAADLDLKGRSQLEPRLILERLIARLSKQAGPTRM